MPESTQQFIVHQFWTKFITGPNGEPLGEDWCEYGPFSPDGQERTRNSEKISRLEKVMTYADQTNPTAIMAKDRWSVIEPRYKAWKEGQELPEDGTPLAAWNGVRPEQADILKTKGITTVERLASLPDHQLPSIPLPGMAQLVRAAKLYVEASDTHRVSAQLAAKDAEINQLKADQEELAESVRELMREKHEREATVVTPEKLPGTPTFA